MPMALKAIQYAWLKGALLIVLIVLSDITARNMGLGGSEWLLYIVWVLFMVAVYISTYAAPIHKLIVGMSHTLTISFLFALSNWVQSHFDMGVDLGGENGFWVVFVLMYVTSFIPALIASVLGLIAFGKKYEKRIR